jgi:fatty acid desaturase
MAGSRVATAKPAAIGAVPGADAGPLDVRAMRGAVHRDGMTRPQPWRNLGHLAAQILLYAVLASVGFVVDRLWAWILVSAAMGLLLLAPGALMHQAVHGHLFRSRRANALVGDLAGAVLLSPWGTYRAFHAEHHATTATPADPEGVPLAPSSRAELLLLPIGGFFTVGQMWWFTARTLVGRPPRWVRTATARRSILVSAAVVAGFGAVLVVGLVTAPSFTVHVWLVPFLVAMVVVYPAVFLPEHAYGAPGSALENSRTTTSNRLLSWIFWNNNFHAIHHLLPMVVHQHAPALSWSVRDHQHGDWWSSGYVHFLWSLGRRLPTFPSRGDGAVLDLTGTTDVLDLTDGAQARATSSRASGEK